MGRPIKKEFIGNTSVTGKQIACYAWVPGDSQSRLSYISEQTGTGRYVATSADGAHSGVVTLANTDGGNLIVGEASISVTPYSGPVEYAEVVYDNVVKTWNGTKYKWYFAGVALPDAGSATIQSS